jgi:chromosome segregation ATPase
MSNPSTLESESETLAPPSADEEGPQTPRLVELEQSIEETHQKVREVSDRLQAQRSHIAVMIGRLHSDRKRVGILSTERGQRKGGAEALGKNVVTAEAQLTEEIHQFEADLGRTGTERQRLLDRIASLEKERTALVARLTPKREDAPGM